MTEHKKFKRPKHQPASIDGIVMGPRNLGASTVSSYQPSRQAQTPSFGDNLRRADGFHPSRQGATTGGHLASQDAEAKALLDEPIVLDDEQPNKKKKHYYGHKHPRLRKVIKRSALLLLVAVLVGGGYLGFKFYKTERDIFKGGGSAPGLAANVDINALKGEGDGRVNILLLGHDGPGFDGANLTDTMLLASIDPVNHKAVLLSIPRDLWVKIPGNGYQKINAAYAYGLQNSSAKTLAGQEADGLALLDQTLQPILGITINYHVLLDFQAFQQVVDALGGVTVNVPSELYDPTIEWENNYNPVIALPGVQTMDGAKALLYARSRETSSDFARSQRQRALLVAIKQKAFSAGTFSNPIKISDLLGSLGNNVYTDLSLNDTTRLYQIMSQIGSGQINSLDFVTPPNDLITTGDMDGLSIDEPKAGLFDYSDIQAFVRSSLPDGFIVKENAKVAVYNATDVAGAATAEGALLKTYGYNVTTIANAPTTTNLATTTVVDLSKGKDKYTRHYLEDRFSTTALSKVPVTSGITPPVGTSFVIIIGEDVANSSQ